VFSGINPTLILSSKVNVGVPKTFISQDSGSINHIIHFIVVVLPAQFGHRKPYISPFSTEKLTSISTSFLASTLFIFLTSRILDILFFYNNIFINIIFINFKNQKNNN